MSDEKDLKNIHGFDIHPGDHDHVLKFMATHMNKEQLKDMVKRAESGHSADFRYTSHNGEHSDFKLVHEGGKLVIHRAHHY